MYMFVGKDEVDYYNVNQHEYHAQNVVIHEHYNSTTSENDIALVKTSTKIVFNSNVAPVCSPGIRPAAVWRPTVSLRWLR